MEIMIFRVQSLIRGEVAEQPFEILVQERGGLGDRIMNDDDTKPVLEMLKEKYGVEVIKIEIRDIDPQEKWRAMTMKRIIAEQKAKATVITADARKKRMAQETTGVVAAMVEQLCSAFGMKEDEFKEKLRTDLDFRKEVFARCEKILGHKMAADQGTLVEVLGASSLDKAIMDVFAFLRSGRKKS